MIQSVLPTSPARSTEIKIGGGIVFWKSAVRYDARSVAEAFDAVGLKELAPAPATPLSSLRGALDCVFANSKTLIRPNSSRTGFVVVDEDRGEDQNSYACRLSVMLDTESSTESDDSDSDDSPSNRRESHTLRFAVARDNDAKSDDVLGAFQSLLGQVSTQSMSTALVKLVHALGGTSLRDQGAVYWIPERYLGTWDAVAKAVEAAATKGQAAIYCAPALFNEQTVRMVRDGIVHEIDTEVARIKFDLENGELGERALESRLAYIGQMEQKVSNYEGMLNVFLGHLKDDLEQLRQHRALGNLMASASSGPVFG